MFRSGQILTLHNGLSMTPYRPTDVRPTAPKAVACSGVRARSLIPLVFLGLLSFAFLLGSSMPVDAQGKQKPALKQRISSGDAANIARRSVGGKVLSVRPGGTHYRVRILKRNGVVTRVLVNRGNGRVSR